MLSAPASMAQTAPVAVAAPVAPSPAGIAPIQGPGVQSARDAREPQVLTVINDLSADSRGGVYFTDGGVFYADSKGVITQYGTNLVTNGIILSPDEKTLYAVAETGKSPAQAAAILAIPTLAAGYPGRAK